MAANQPGLGSKIARRFARFKVSAPVLIERDGGEPTLGMTANAAVGGCCILASDGISWTVGDLLRLTFEDDQRARATIRWVDGNFIAVEFDEPFAALVLDDAARPVVISSDRMEPRLTRRAS